MANIIKIKRSSVKDQAPSSLEYGELALNYADARLYFKDSTGSYGYFEGLTASVATQQAATAGQPTDTEVLTWMV